MQARRCFILRTPATIGRQSHRPLRAAGVPAAYRLSRGGTSRRQGYSADKDRLDLYFSNEYEVAKLEATRSVGKTSFDYSGAWLVLKADHSDTRDLAFDHADSPLLLGTDGGLHHTTNKGLNWTYIGGGHDGYDALQITEIDGQWIDSLKRHDLYFGTQDNDLWSSKDFGKTWQDGNCSRNTASIVFIAYRQRRMIKSPLPPAPAAAMRFPVRSSLTSLVGRTRQVMRTIQQLSRNPYARGGRFPHRYLKDWRLLQTSAAPGASMR